MSNLKIWNRVQDQSVLEVWVEADDGAPLVASARLLDDLGNQRQWSNSDLRPGPATHVLRVPRGYVVRVRVFFESECEGIIKSRIVKPDDSTHGNPYSYPVAGNAGDVIRATIIAVTRKSLAGHP